MVRRSFWPLVLTNRLRRSRMSWHGLPTQTHRKLTFDLVEHPPLRGLHALYSMCILASREHTCIHPEVSTSKNKNEECKKKLDGTDVSVTYWPIDLSLWPHYSHPRDNTAPTFWTWARSSALRLSFVRWVWTPPGTSRTSCPSARKLK